MAPLFGSTYLRPEGRKVHSLPFRPASFFSSQTFFLSVPLLAREETIRDFSSSSSPTGIMGISSLATLQKVEVLNS